MSESELKAAASALTGGLRSQVLRMARVDGLSSGEIGGLLGIPAGIVEEVLRGDGGASAVADEGAGAANIETRITDEDVDCALGTLRELCASSESDAVRSVSAQRLLEYKAGALRPKKTTSVQVGVTVDTMNVLIQEAVRAYAANGGGEAGATPAKISEEGVGIQAEPRLVNN